MRKIILVVGLLIVLPAFAATEAGLTPSNPLYFLDTLLERINLALTINPEKKVIKALLFAEERLAEADQIADKDSEAVKPVLENYELNLLIAKNKLTEVADEEKSEELLNRIADNTARHQEILVIVLNKVPDEAKQAIERAMEVSAKEREDVLRQISELKREVVELKEEIAGLKKQQEEKLVITAPDFDNRSKAIEIKELKKQIEELKSLDIKKNEERAVVLTPDATSTVPVSEPTPEPQPTSPPTVPAPAIVPVPEPKPAPAPVVKELILTVRTAEEGRTTYIVPQQPIKVELTNWNSVLINAFYKENNMSKPVNISFSENSNTSNFDIQPNQSICGGGQFLVKETSKNSSSCSSESRANFEFFPKTLGIYTISATANGITKTVTIEVVPYQEIVPKAEKLSVYQQDANNNSYPVDIPEYQIGKENAVIGRFKLSDADEPFFIDQILFESSIGNEIVLNLFSYSTLFGQFLGNGSLITTTTRIHNNPDVGYAFTIPDTKNLQKGTHQLTIKEIKAFGQFSGLPRKVSGLPITFTFTIK